MSAVSAIRSLFSNLSIASYAIFCTIQLQSAVADEIANFKEGDPLEINEKLDFNHFKTVRLVPYADTLGLNSAETSKFNKFRSKLASCQSISNREKEEAKKAWPRQMRALEEGMGKCHLETSIEKKIDGGTCTISVETKVTSSEKSITIPASKGWRVTKPLSQDPGGMGGPGFNTFFSISNSEKQWLPSLKVSFDSSSERKFETAFTNQLTTCLKKFGFQIPSEKGKSVEGATRDGKSLQ